ncbi:MAG: peroxiredoxin family protein [Planctomycetota bacterium]
MPMVVATHHPRTRRRLSRVLTAVVLLAGVFAWSGRSARAEGANLNGRTAPDLVFQEGMNGVAPGTRVSSFRGRVVWIKFWLRDCPHCRASMPRLQETYDRWRDRGLVVITVLHEFGPEDATLAAYLRQNAYDFPIAIDRDGSLARRYGVRKRPVDYVVGVDGRIKTSNAAPEAVIQAELAQWRIGELGSMPAELASVRTAVWNRDYAGALRAAEAASAAPGASAEVAAAAARVTTLAGAEVRARIAYAERLFARGKRHEARALYDRLVTRFAGTSLEPTVRQARDAFLARVGG